jgi:predicted deacylase
MQELPEFDFHQLPQLMEQRGRKLWASLRLIGSFFGAPVRVPVAIITGNERGPLAVVLGAAHGDEYTGVEISRRLACQIQPGELRGTLVCLPIQNALAFQANQRFTPGQSLGATSMDLNRAYPGSEDGSVTERIAFTIFTHIIKPAHYVFDLHSATTGDCYVSTAYLPLENPDPRLTRELVRAFGLGVIIESELEGTLLRAAAREGIPGIIVESGAGGQLSPSLVESGVAGMNRALTFLRMLPGEVTWGPEPLVSQEHTTIRAPAGGFLYANVAAGESVAQGDIIAHVESFPDRKEEVRAPHAGVVVRLTNRAVMMPGDRIALLVPSAPA